MTDVNAAALHLRLPAPRARAYCNAVMPRDEPPGDEALMLAYRDGNAAAFEQLYRRHRGPLFRYLLRQCRDGGAAEELFQDIWLNVIRARSSYKATARFTTYLYRLAHNRVVDHYRRRSPAALVSFDDDDYADAGPAASRQHEPHTAYETKEQAARLLALIDALPEAQREAFLLQHEAGMSIEEIAEVAGVNRETAKSRLRYAMAKLRAGMAGFL